MSGPGSVLGAMVTRMRSLRTDFSFASESSRSLVAFSVAGGCGSGFIDLAEAFFSGSLGRSELSAEVINVEWLSSMAVVHFGGKDEVVFSQPIDVMGPEPQCHFPVRQVNVGMVVFFFGYFPDAVGEVQGLPEVVEG